MTTVRVVANALIVCRARSRARSRKPLLKCGWPQQVCASGKSTAMPRRRSNFTVAIPTSGKRAAGAQLERSTRPDGTRLEGSSRPDGTREAAAPPEVWQLHRSPDAKGANAPEDRIANLDEKCEGRWIKVSARKDGSFSVTNGRTGRSREYR